MALYWQEVKGMLSYIINDTNGGVEWETTGITHEECAGELNECFEAIRQELSRGVIDIKEAVDTNQKN